MILTGVNFDTGSYLKNIKLYNRVAIAAASGHWIFDDTVNFNNLI